ncbi:Glra2 [Symbiodinium sp. CCMP2592]|nr:Glra2 [Symbiodinium sp. CCMP2592]
MDQSASSSSSVTSSSTSRSSSDARVLPPPVIEGIAPEGYENGAFPRYTQNWTHAGGGNEVDCSQAIKVYVDIAAHELKSVDDNNEQFHMVFVMKLGWLDPDLKNFKSRISVRATPGTSDLHLRKLDVVITKMYANGDVEFIDLSDPRQRVQTFRKGEYFGIQDPDWNEYFFPSYTILNLKHGADATVETRRLLWCDEKGGFTSYRIRFDAKLQETMDLRNFPRDRQLCRIRMTAEKPIEEFQFVVLKGEKGISQMCGMWQLDGGTVYARHLDRYLLFPSQRSCVNAVYHLEREGEYYMNGVLLLIFLVSIFSLCTFCIPLDDVSGRLKHLSTCLLAVFACMYVINDRLPRKRYFTGADAYIIFACSFQVLLVLETLCFQIFGFLESPTLTDRRVGLALLIVWLTVNCLLRWRWRRDTDAKAKAAWQAVYQASREPYAPVNECSECGKQWLCKQCEHKSPTKRCFNWPTCYGEGDSIKTIYKTPWDQEVPLVAAQDFPQPPAHLKQAPAGHGTQK